MSKTYHRPIGIVHGETARRLVDQEVALPLAGGGAAFTHVEILARNAPPQTMSISDWDVDGSLRSRITSARAPIAGLDFNEPQVMGILNVTPDSFSDGGEHFSGADAVARAQEMVREGAAIVDVGGESTRPGSDTVPVQNEVERVVPVVEAIADGICVSIDTRKAAVMKKAHKVGARIINDVSALTFDDQSLDVATETNLPLILMHAQGDPKTMQEAPHYEDVLLDVFDYLEGRIDACEAAGIDRRQIIVDPGIGFGKTLEHNARLLSGLSLFHGLGCPVLLGASRKRFIAMASCGEDEKDRLGGSLAAVLEGARQGVQIFRVHDVRESMQALRIFRLVR